MSSPPYFKRSPRSPVDSAETARNLYASIATSLSAFVEEIKAYETARNRRESDDARVRDALLSVRRCFTSFPRPS